MKKIFIGIVCSVFVIIIGIFAFKLMVREKNDVSLKSADEEVEFVFEKVTSESEKVNGEFQVSFNTDRKMDFYDEYIKNNPYFVGFIDEQNNLTNNKTNGFLFCKERHYFFATKEDDNVTLYELVGAFYTEEMGYYINIPYSGGLAYAETNIISFEELIGVDSFEDLVMFYGRIEDSKYEIDKENETIYLSVYAADGTVVERGTKLVVTKEGVEITFLEKQS